MNILKLFLQESRAGLMLCALYSLGAGVTNGLLLVIASEVIASRNFYSLRIMAGFFGMIILSQLLRYATNMTIVRLVETLTVKVQLVILEALQGCRLNDFEKIGHPRIHNALTEDCAAIRQIIPEFVELISAAITIAVCMIYLAWLSLFLFFLGLLIIAIGVSLYLARQKTARAKFFQARSQADRIYKLIVDFLHGFKELKINRLKSHDLFDNNLKPGLNQARDLRIDAARMIQCNYSLGMAMFFFILGLILFYLPHHYPADTALISKSAMVLLYLIGPGGQFLYSALQTVRLKVAIVNLENLQILVEEKAASSSNEKAESTGNRFAGFEKIRLNGIQFTYSGNPPFYVGPLDLTIQRGQVLFITGGNGSGKTTLSKLLTGLYVPSEGEIMVDETPVSEKDYPAYRSLFSAVFSDFYLFDRFYGIADPDPDRFESWLKKFNLLGKITVDKKKLSTTSLSSGQRRRLALLTALLDDRPILVLDELTADQEAGFREYFYGEFVPALKEQGKTIVIITHDDRFFHLADHLVKLEYGAMLQ